jgi:DNA-binding CsgD family transcriptional regulator
VFDSLLQELVSRSIRVTKRAAGVAFFKTARDLYGLERMTYVCVDIPAKSRLGLYSHCGYSDAEAIHCVSHRGLGEDLADWFAGDDRSTDHTPNGGSNDRRRAVTILLRKHASERAALQAILGPEASDQDASPAGLARELRILANYFHSHVLRMHGHDAARSILISAKELDCLKWTAEGKTAWEASVILGISERTVRFHLNAAREKLNCTTTTQAVAKAIANQIIEL